MEAKAIDFLKRLSEFFAPSGFETERLRVVKQYGQPFADEIKDDRLGSLHFSAPGSVGPVVILPGHVDEVGFVGSGINPLGFLAFNAIGGRFEQVFLGQRVRTRTRKGRAFAVIASKPSDVLPAEQRSKVARKEKMFIDIGCSNEREAKEMGVRIADPVVPKSPFSACGKNVFRKTDGEEKNIDKTALACGEAFDGVGAFVAAEVVRQIKENKGKEDLSSQYGDRRRHRPERRWGCGEPGQRPFSFSRTCASRWKWTSRETFRESSRMRCLPGWGWDPPLLRMTVSHSQPGAQRVPHRHGGGIQDSLPTLAPARRRNGQGPIHQSNAGCRTVVLGVPTWRSHSHAGILSIEDIDDAASLVTEIVRRLEEKTVESFTAV
jgi:endoglucanase